LSCLTQSSAAGYPNVESILGAWPGHNNRDRFFFNETDVACIIIMSHINLCTLNTVL
jgi:hypothetical protein